MGWRYPWGSQSAGSSSLFLLYPFPFQLVTGRLEWSLVDLFTSLLLSRPLPAFGRLFKNFEYLPPLNHVFFSDASGSGRFDYRIVVGLWGTVPPPSFLWSCYFLRNLTRR